MQYSHLLGQDWDLDRVQREVNPDMGAFPKGVPSVEARDGSRGWSGYSEFALPIPLEARPELCQIGSEGDPCGRLEMNEG